MALYNPNLKKVEAFILQIVYVWLEVYECKGGEALAQLLFNGSELIYWMQWCHYLLNEAMRLLHLLAAILLASMLPMVEHYAFSNACVASFAVASRTASPPNVILVHHAKT